MNFSRQLFTKKSFLPKSISRKMGGAPAAKGKEPYPTFEWKHEPSHKPPYVTTDKAYFLGVKPGTPMEFWEYPTYFVLGFAFILTIYGIANPRQTTSVFPSLLSLPLHQHPPHSSFVLPRIGHGERLLQEMKRVRMVKRLNLGSFWLLLLLSIRKSEVTEGKGNK
jgi:hypothetical protein